MKMSRTLPLLLLPIALTLISCDQSLGDKTSMFFKNLFGAKKLAATENPSIESLMPAIQSQARKAIHLRAEGQNRFSKIGGLPELPKNIAWPSWKGKPLAFIAQIKFSEINGKAELEDYPTRGLLYVFYDQDQSTWGFDTKDRDSWRTVYVDDEKVPVAKPAKPLGLETVYQEKAIGGALIDTYPDSFERTGTGPKFNDAQLESYYDFRAQAFGGKPQHTIGGYPSPVQGDDMELQCELTSNGLYCGDASGYKDPKAKKLSANAKDWVLLLQIDTDDDANMMWGDVGMLYFWIKKADLKAKNFDKVWMVLQCG